MALEKSPSFQFYPRDYLSDPNVAAMSHFERGVYVDLLCYCWQQGTLPPDPRDLAKLVGEPVRVFRRIWRASIAKCFRVGPDQRLIHKRLELERSKQSTFREQQSRKGRKGAQIRWNGNGRGIAGPGHPEPAMPDDSFAVCNLQSATKERSS